MIKLVKQPSKIRCPFCFKPLKKLKGMYKSYMCRGHFWIEFNSKDLSVNQTVLSIGKYIYTLCPSYKGYVMFKDTFDRFSTQPVFRVDAHMLIDFDFGIPLVKDKVDKILNLILLK